MERRSAWLAPAAILIPLLAALAAWWVERPPAPAGLDAPAHEFSAARARNILEEIAVRPHTPGSAEHRRVREWLVGELQALGFDVDVHLDTTYRRAGQRIEAVTVRNVLARRDGSATTGGVALAAHYDSRELSPGAGDDGAGVAAILEAVRALSVGEALRNDLFVVLTDAEEFGLHGARAVVAEHPWWPEIDLLLNFEARGAAGTSIMFETNAENGWVVGEFAKADPHPSANSLYYEIYKVLPNDTDFSVFKAGGVTGLNFAFAEGADAYHRPTDTIGNLSLASLQHHGEHALALSRHFGNLNLGESTRAADVVFFTLPVIGVLTYSVGWAKGFAVALLLMAAAVSASAMARGRLRLPGMLMGLILFLGAGVLAASLAWLLVPLLRRAHHEVGSIAGRLLYDETWYGLAVVGFAAAATALMLSILRRRFDAASLTAGSMIVVLALAIVTPWLAPGTSMLFLWPAVLALLALWRITAGPAGSSYGPADFLVFGSVAIGIVAVLFPLPYAIFMGISISGAAFLAVALVLMSSLLIPSFDFALARLPRLPAMLFAASVALVAGGLVSARPGPGRPVPVVLNYELNHDQASASWTTTTVSGGPWLERFMGEDNVQAGSAPASAELGPMRTAPAPLASVQPMSVEVLDDSTDDGGIRVLLVGLRSLVSAELIHVRPQGDAGVTLNAVNGDPVAWPDGMATVGGWQLFHRGEPPAGQLVLQLSAVSQDEPIELVVSERRYSLPSLPGYDIERPATVVAHGLATTDTSTFHQTLVFD